MSVARLVRRVVGAIVHNWPLKLAALVLAVLLYIGLVATQGSSSVSGPIAVLPEHVPSGTTITNQLRSVDEIRYIAPADLGRLTANDFHATVDLSNVQPTGTTVSVPVQVVPSDPRVTILEVLPRSIPVVLDQEVSISVPVKVVRAVAPPGIEVGDTTVTPQQVTVSGPSSAVKRVDSVRVQVALDPNGLDFDQEVQGTAVDASGVQVTGVEITPRTVHVTIPLYTNKQSRTVAVNPVLAGDPAPGFRVASIGVAPLTVTLEGDADQLANLSSADTAPVQIYGATRDVTQQVTFALPTGVTPLGATTVTVTVGITPITETRTYTAGLRIDGADPTLGYTTSVSSVLLTVYGSSADLDRLGSSPLTVGLDVSGFGPGKHQVTVVPSVPSGLTVVSINPTIVTVTVTPPPSPGPSDGGSTPAPPSPTPAPS